MWRCMSTWSRRGCLLLAACIVLGDFLNIRIGDVFCRINNKRVVSTKQPSSVIHIPSVSSL